MFSLKLKGSLKLPVGPRNLVGLGLLRPQIIDRNIEAPSAVDGGTGPR